MSLRDKNKGSLVVTAGAKEASLSGSLRRATSSVAMPTNRGTQAIQKAAVRNSISKGGNLCFLIDATASRSSSWMEAQSIQKEMFQSISGVGQMQLRLMHFGGDRLTTHNWETDTSKITNIMSEVSCSGGCTQHVEGLNALLEGNGDVTTNGVILIGDSFEENFDDLKQTAQALKEKNIKAFTFLDGDDCTAEKAFKMLSEVTGGVFAKFGPEMPLNDLCQGVALLTVGGESALTRLTNADAKRLLLTASPS